MTQEEALQKLKHQLEQLQYIRSSSPFSISTIKTWMKNSKTHIKYIFNTDDGESLRDFSNIEIEINWTLENILSSSTGELMYRDKLDLYLNEVQAFLESKIEAVNNYWDRLHHTPYTINQNSSNTDYIAIIESICNRFHLVANQLTIRYSNRQTLKITDEYDVQDLFHSLLRLNFDILTKEEPIPNFASRSSRVDFFLPEQEIFIELKKTRQGLGDKELREQLIVDIAQYKKHGSPRVVMLN